MEEPHNRRVKGRLRWEDSGGFQEALGHRLQTQREAAGQWEKAVPAPGRVLHVQYLLPLHTASWAPTGPTVRVRYHQGHDQAQNMGHWLQVSPLHRILSASGPRRKPEKKWDPDSLCHLLRELLR